MGIHIKSTKEVFITPSLPSSFPYVKVINGSLFIRINDHRTPYISLENYLSVMESHGVVVKTTEELSSALGVSMIEVADNVFLINGSLHKIFSLKTLLSAINISRSFALKCKENHFLYYDVFKDLFRDYARSKRSKRSGAKKPVKDFNGRVFPSQTAMLEFYGIPSGTFNSRMRSGFSLKDSLTLPQLKKSNKVKCKDHKGRVFSSINAMADFYGIAPQTLRYRLKKGLFIKDALTKPIQVEMARNKGGRRVSSRESK